jgi:hypothetical protein
VRYCPWAPPWRWQWLWLGAFLLGARSVTGQTLYVDAGQRFVPSARDVMFGDEA